jgi:O-acetyl-ADP-ribose deacetylase (regulator of RNase III)
MTENHFAGGKIIVKVGDITAEKTGAIVNAANYTLLGGGGVDGAIHSKGGKEILEECRRLREFFYPKGLPTGQAVITTAGNLFADYVIHTVGPIFGQHGGAEAELLAGCYRNSLNLAVENSLRSIAFPSISTGAFGYPKHEAAQVASSAIQEFIENDSFIEEIRLVFFSEADAKVFLKHQKFN